MKNSECAVYMLSSRKFLLNKCLKEFWKNFNSKYNFPVFVYYFAGTYDQKFISYILDNNPNKIEFIEIFPRIPENIPEEEIFYNRDYNPYVKKRFSGKSKRIGFLYMERFVSNITSYNKYGCITDHLKKYKYTMRIDDDSWFKKKIDFNLFEILNNYPMATAYTWNYVNENVINTREKLWDFYLDYIKKKKITPKNISLRTAVEQNDEQKMHKLLWSAGNCNLYNIELFKKNNWEEYIKAVNDSNGQFKYRWGDIEVIGLFIYTFFENPLYDFDLIKKKLYLNKFYKSKYYLLSIMAPSPEDKFNINFIIFKIFYMVSKILKIFKIKR